MDYVALIYEARGVVDEAMRYSMGAPEAVGSPVVAAVFAELVRDERERLAREASDE